MCAVHAVGLCVVWVLYMLGMLWSGLQPMRVHVLVCGRSGMGSCFRACTCMPQRAPPPASKPLLRCPQPPEPTHPLLRPPRPQPPAAAAPEERDEQEQHKYGFVESVVRNAYYISYRLDRIASRACYLKVGLHAQRQRQGSTSSVAVAVAAYLPHTAGHMHATGPAM